MIGLLVGLVNPTVALANEDPEGCKSALALPVVDTPAKAVAAAWRESLELALASESSRSEEIIEELKLLRASPPETRMLFEIANRFRLGAVFVENLQSLGDVAENFQAAGVFDDSSLQSALLHEWDGMLARHGAMSAADAEAVSTRVDLSAPVSVVPVHGRVFVTPTELPNGSVLVLDLGGSFEIVTQGGRGLVSGRLGRELSHAPLLLDDGRILVSSAAGKAWILNSSGRVESHLEIPVSAGGKEPFRLSDGGVLFVGGGGDILLLNPDGSIRARQELHASFGSRPVQAPDGTLYLLAGALSTVFRLSPNGDLLGQKRIFEDRVLNGSPLRLLDGSWLVMDHRGRIHVLNPDWTPRMRWWFFSPITFKPLGGATGSMRLLENGNILVRGWKDQLAVFNPAGGLIWSLDDALISHSLPVEVEPGVFLVQSASRGYVFCGPGMPGFRSAAIEVSAPGGVAPVRLSDGTIAISHPHHNLMQIIGSDGRERFRYRFKGRITAPPVLLSNGAYAVPVFGEGVVIVDPKLLAEEEGAQ